MDLASSIFFSVNGYLSRGLGGALSHHNATADPQELRVVQEAAVDTALLPRGQGNLGGETQRQHFDILLMTVISGFS